eukprot:936727-Amorphochlora_amoeboformis.AAC.2
MGFDDLLHYPRFNSLHSRLTPPQSPMVAPIRQSDVASSGLWTGVIVHHVTLKLELDSGRIRAWVPKNFGRNSRKTIGTQRILKINIHIS